MTTEETLYSGTVTDIVALVKACDFPSNAYVLVERQPKTLVADDGRQNLLRFAYLKDGIDEAGLNIASYTSGRVFHRDFELRWEQDAVTVGKTRVVYIGVDRTLPENLKPKAALHHEGVGRNYYLFGELLSKDRLTEMGLESEEGLYAETRVPRLLRYPRLDRERQPQRLQLVAHEYDHPELGHMYRFLGLIPAKE
ncbi:MAG: hypothetical protein ACR2H5_22025 [Ktedonobacteraceae bacterium]